MKPVNLPRPGEVVLDHSGHFVAEVDAARSALERLGFTVTPLSAQRQPDPETGEMKLTGTGNICVMLPEGYLEFLVHTADTPIGLEFKAALDRRAGLHLAAFGLADAEARHAELVKDGLDMRPLVHFSRDVETGTGIETAAFTVARLAAGTMPEGRVQSLTHHNEAALWQPRWTGHANGARRLEAMVLSAPAPAESAERFSRFLGRPVEVHGTGLRIALDRGALDFLPEDAATALVGHAVDPGRPCLVGLQIGLGDIGALPPDPAARWVDGSLVVPFDPALGSGVWLFHPG